MYGKQRLVVSKGFCTTLREIVAKSVAKIVKGAASPAPKKQGPGFKENDKGKRHSKKYKGSGIPDAKRNCPISDAFGKGNGLTHFCQERNQEQCGNVTAVRWHYRQSQV